MPLTKRLARARPGRSNFASLLGRFSHTPSTTARTSSRRSEAREGSTDRGAGRWRADLAGTTTRDRLPRCDHRRRRAALPPSQGGIEMKWLLLLIPAAVAAAVV